MPDTTDISGRDDEELAAIAEILAGLPEDHPARRAHADGRHTLELTHLVGDRALADRLIQAYLDGLERMRGRTQHFKP